MKTDSLYKKIADELNLSQLIETYTIQNLWGGYGELVRLKFKEKTIIVKHIKLPKPKEHPRGWNTELSHMRKLHSYKVEVNWYKNFSKQKDNRCRVPKSLKTFQTANEYLIVMEDLSNAGFKHTVSNANKKHLLAVIKWLANFHAKYLGVKSDLLWEIGTYWHLDTRPDEFELLEDKELKKFAKKIDSELKNTKYQTIVHGDAKLANFCFDVHGSSCAAVDFQYIGHGCGMKDLAYFMSSAIEPELCEQMEKWVLDTYFKEFSSALKYYQVNLDASKVEEEWRALFSVAWADFQRFIKGWSPNHFKINTYTENLTKRAINYLKEKESLDV